MTSARIKQAALAHFAHKGYEGASLADIAGEVGIKKQSIYTHFKGKDELFLELYRDIYALELEFASRYFRDPAPPPVDEFLYRFLVRCRERYEQDDQTKFFLRVSFFPPPHLHEEISRLGCQYVDTLESLLLLHSGKPWSR
ncbi:TetR/AcrR family transcriptional regulator [Paenibacillus sp. CC-CFT747]|nr:TetR/AcrR family transcriptional regulator [Paenibacillus sp. CC-CFT747]